MAVYTDITEQELAGLLARYDIGTLTSYRGIAEGVENSNFMLTTTEGPFILTLYEKRVNADDLPFFIALMQHLAAHGVSCPLPVTMRDGTAIAHLADRPAAIVTFLEGVWPRRPDVDNCRQVGEALAQLHLAGADFAMTRRNGLTLEDWRPLWEKSKQHAETVESGLTAAVEADLAALEAGWPRQLPQGVIHADLFPDNVFFLGDRLSGLIDFYFACTDILAYDLVTCINAWCFERDGSFNLTKSKALIDGYQSVRTLEDGEIAALPLLARGSALRFMLTRLYDWINTPEGSLVVKKDPKEYSRKMAFHRSVADASAYGVAVPDR